MSPLAKYSGLIVCILISFLPSLTGVFIRPGEWYATLVKSPLNPPAWVFGPAWTILYLLMGISAWLIWSSGEFKKVWPLLALFLIHLIVNALWSYLFFGLQNPCYALVDIFILFALIILMIITFSQVNTMAAVLLIPYLLWVGFASYLNLYVWLKN